MGSVPSGFRRDYNSASQAADKRVPHWPFAVGTTIPLIAAVVLILASIGSETVEYPEIDDLARTAEPLASANASRTAGPVASANASRTAGPVVSANASRTTGPVVSANASPIGSEPGISGRDLSGDERYPPPEVPASEGFEPRRYCDGRYVAIGWGHLVVTTADGTRLLCRDWETALENAERVLGPAVWATLDSVRRDVAAEIALMSGALGLARFVDLIDALRAERWVEAAAAILDSTLGCPADMLRDECLARPNPRRERMAHWMREGETAGMRN